MRLLPVLYVFQQIVRLIVAIIGVEILQVDTVTVIAHYIFFMLLFAPNVFLPAFLYTPVFMLSMMGLQLKKFIQTKNEITEDAQ